MFPIRTILHPTDFSEPSRYAFRMASALARDYHARLIVLHVGITPAPMLMEGVLPLDLEEYESGLREELRRVAPPDGSRQVERRLILGVEPVSEIVRVAETEPCDLIVMGTHGRSGLRRVLMGSVAEHVQREAPCPVLTVRVPVVADEEVPAPEELVGAASP